MNSLTWPEGATIEDIPDRLVEIARIGGKHQVMMEIYHAANQHPSPYEIVETDSGKELQGRPTEFDGEDMFIIAIAYGNDANRVMEIVSEHDDG